MSRTPFRWAFNATLGFYAARALLWTAGFLAILIVATCDV